MDRSVPARSRGRRRLATWVVLALLVAVSPAGGGASLAAFTSARTAAVTSTTQVLDPPTNVVCATTLVVCTATLAGRPQLSWTATPDTFATGYQVWRSTTSGSGYAMVATVPGRTTTSWTDTGSLTVFTTYYYVLRSASPAWTSVPSNQVTVTITLGG